MGTYETYMGGSIRIMFDITVLKHGHDEPFVRKKIKKSLRRETSISRKNAKFITKKVHAFIISTGLYKKIITAPLIREITCVMLLQFGLELERMQYTRLGTPKADITEVYLWWKQCCELRNIPRIPYLENHLIKEYMDVNIHIETLREQRRDAADDR